MFNVLGLDDLSERLCLWVIYSSELEMTDNGDLLSNWIYSNFAAIEIKLTVFRNHLDAAFKRSG